MPPPRIRFWVFCDLEGKNRSRRRCAGRKRKYCRSSRIFHGRGDFANAIRENSQASRADAQIFIGISAVLRREGFGGSELGIHKKEQGEGNQTLTV
jgi:hypothetical protein